MGKFQFMLREYLEDGYQSEHNEGILKNLIYLKPEIFPLQIILLFIFKNTIPVPWQKMSQCQFQLSRKNVDEI